MRRIGVVQAAAVVAALVGGTLGVPASAQEPVPGDPALCAGYVPRALAVRTPRYPCCEVPFAATPAAAGAGTPSPAATPTATPALPEGETCTDPWDYPATDPRIF